MARPPLRHDPKGRQLVVAALAWYDEPPEFLQRCVRSLEGVCDALVALDGAWKLQPEGHHYSPEVQQTALLEAVAETGLHARLLSSDALFESQVEKRQTLMQLASEECDWILVIDADEAITACDPHYRRLLAETELEVAYVRFRNLNRGETMPGIPLNAGLNRRLFRAGTTLKTVHSGYMREGRNLLVSEDALDLTDYLTIEHDNVNRGPQRNQRSRLYRQLRATTGTEMWVKL